MTPPCASAVAASMVERRTDVYKENLLFFNVEKQCENEEKQSKKD